MAGLWRDNPETRGGKYLVQRRDGTVPEWPWFVLGARDKAAQAGLRAYADEAEKLGYDPAYVAGIRRSIEEWRRHELAFGAGDPDGAPHREDDPVIATKLAEADRLAKKDVEFIRAALNSLVISGFKVECKFSPDDDAYIAAVPTLVGCAAEGKTSEEAILRLIPAMAEWMREVEKNHTLPSAP